MALWYQSTGSFFTPRRGSEMSEKKADNSGSYVGNPGSILITDEYSKQVEQINERLMNRTRFSTATGEDLRTLARFWLDIEAAADETDDQLRARCQARMAEFSQPIREVTRLITYRGPADAMAKQFGRSLPDGTRDGKVHITVRTLEDTAGILLGSADPLAAVLRRLGEVEQERNAALAAARDAEKIAAVLRQDLDAARQEATNARANLAQWQAAHK